MATDFEHEPVLLSECLEYLAPQPGSVVVDGTVGGGGHSVEILGRIAPSGTLIGLDLDEQALEAAGRRLETRAGEGSRVQLCRASFRRLDEVLHELGIEAVDGVLLDLGVSSHQLDTPERGFRFSSDDGAQSPLDMRMDRRSDTTAATLLQRSSVEELEGWFREYGELPGSRRLARRIVARRSQSPLQSREDLLQLIREAGIGRNRRHHPATLVFQALRIAVNDELNALRDGLAAAIAMLRPGGRLVVISYHSLEDRIVKHTFRDEARGCRCPPQVPVCVCGAQRRLRVITRRPVRPSQSEAAGNPRSRSARLRAAERVTLEAAA